MDFDGLWKIIKEDIEMKASQFALTVQNAFRSIFDLDNSDIEALEFGDLTPPENAHNYLYTNIQINYNNSDYKIYFKIYHYKAKVERKKFGDFGQNDSPETLTYDMMKNPPENLRIVSTIYKLLAGENDQWGLPNRKDLGRVIYSKPIGEIVQSIKDIIDRYGDDSDEGDDVVEPEPVVPSSKKPVLV